MAEQSEELTLFYRDYLAWVEQGAENGAIFVRRSGLCNNLWRWLRNRTSYTDLLYGELVRELMMQFRSAGLYIMYPFNSSVLEYAAERSCHHLNETRMAWVREHAI